MHFELDLSNVVPVLWDMFIAFILMTIGETLHEIHITL